MAIEVVNRQRLAPIDANRIARVAGATLAAVGKPGAGVTVAFVRDRAIRVLNRRFREIDRPTDVLSFPASAGSEDGADGGFVSAQTPEYLGDVVVSTDTALRQANEAGHAFGREVDELVMHGVVHLCGYDHETDHGEMNRLELRLRRKLLDRDLTHEG